MKLKIVFFTFSLKGGAGNALRRHCESLIECGYQVSVIVGDGKKYAQDYVLRFEDLVNISWIDRYISRFGQLVYKFIGDNCFSGRLSIKIVKTRLVTNADIIELRMLHSGGHPPYFNLSSLKDISKRKCIVWRLSDMWAFTGFCPYSFDCSRFQSNCGSCPQLSFDSYKAELPKPKFDFSRYQIKRKKRIYKKLNLHIVAPSTWMKKLVGSSCLQGKRIHEIPAGIDTNLFKKYDRYECRKSLNLPSDGLILACNIPSLHNYRKAFDLLTDVLGHLSDKGVGQFSLMVIGPEKDQSFLETLIFPTFCTGFIEQDIDLAKAYSAADIFLFPSRADNSAQVLLESAACSLPVVCFDTAGNSQYVKHGETGFTVSAYDTSLFAEYVIKIIRDDRLSKNLANNARRFAVEQFCIEKQLKEFVELYEQCTEY